MAFGFGLLTTPLQLAFLRTERQCSSKYHEPFAGPWTFAGFSLRDSAIRAYATVYK